MEKRVLLAMFLSVLIIIVFEVFTSKYYKKPLKEQTQKTEKPSSDNVSKRGDDSLLDLESKDVLLETNLLRIVFSESGGWIKSLLLKGYKDTKGKEIELINEKLGGGLWFSDSTFNKGDYKVMRGKDDKGIEKLEFSCLYPSGLEIKKTFNFPPNDYKFDFNLEFINHSNTGIKFGSLYLGWGPGIKEELETEKDRHWHSMVNIFQDKGIIRVKEAKIKEEIKYHGGINWLGMNSKYFLIALLPKEKNSSVFVREKNAKGIEIGAVFPSISLSANEANQFNYSIFAGPKDYNLLKKQGQGLEKNINFGFFSFLSAGLLLTLNWIYQIIHNYGLAILLLTLVIKILLSPLTHKSFVSMQKMQRLQPEVVRLQKKYKDDPKRLNVELMQIYRERKINPFGGCLPMILQIPVFWALFNTLSIAIELRQAPFFGWIKDLSQPDTIFHLPITLPILSNNVNLLPIIMILTQVIQQKMVPSATQTNEQKLMFYAMPIVFGVMFYNFPSGLVLYWTLNNILTIIQQFFLMKKAETVD